MVTFIKTISIRQGRGNVAKSIKYATQIFRYFRAAKPAPAAARPGTGGILKFHNIMLAICSKPRTNRRNIYLVTGVCALAQKTAFAELTAPKSLSK
jgi:hypothetical protein